MTKETLPILEQSENKRVMGIETLALIWDMNYKDTEKLVDQMKEQLEVPDKIQRQYEAAMDAEFSC